MKDVSGALKFHVLYLCWLHLLQSQSLWYWHHRRLIIGIFLSFSCAQFLVCNFCSMFSVASTWLLLACQLLSLMLKHINCGWQFHILLNTLEPIRGLLSYIWGLQNDIISAVVSTQNNTNYSSCFADCGICTDCKNIPDRFRFIIWRNWKKTVKLLLQSNITQHFKNFI